MRRLAFFGAALLMAACVGGGGGEKAAPAQVLRVGSDIEYAPIEFYKENGQDPQGLDIDLARALGDKLGMTV
ncbi:MAG: transporter substrate-binding domain-containing protein, partial [Actinobacteria bacterium]|nr:transporter substrate-binding domain-containing protein [Actinomycetota bacterium]